ncbi:MAG: FAD-dependent thymidylate synthase [Actinobacteria bacterium]|nr:FAD-dependent thymidylate synthase [Actinomycetota bacterium]
MNTYVAEEFTPHEADILRRYFTNLDLPVFALVNLPEVVKGALFARYSRSHKSLRRLFLDEFVTDLDITGDATIDATVGLARAEQLYEKVFVEYGDDSVAQLGGVHLACEQASNLLTKVLEWGRLMSYLEQSTRYIAYDRRLDGRYRFYRDPDVLASGLGTRYVGDMDRMFDTYGELVSDMVGALRELIPQDPSDSDFVYRQAIQARAFDSVRGILPGASLSNVGMFGTGQSYEMLLMRMRAHPLPEARRYAELMLQELRKVIPSFLRRIDQPERGGEWTAYLEERNDEMREITTRLLGGVSPESPDVADSVTLVSFDPDAEVALVTAMLYPYSNLAETAIRATVEAMSAAERVAVVDAYVGDRGNRRHKPGRALERIDYRFDVLADYGAFRDLQRHRMLTIEWQPLTPYHGFNRPEAVDVAGLADRFDEAMDRSAALYEAMKEPFPTQAPYAVALAYRIRFAMQFNAREAMHLIELRSSPQGHPAYRRVAQRMYELIGREAGHPAVAALLRHVDLSDDPPLGRLEAERRAEERRRRAVSP